MAEDRTSPIDRALVEAEDAANNSRVSLDQPPPVYTTLTPVQRSQEPQPSTSLGVPRVLPQWMRAHPEPSTSTGRTRMRRSAARCVSCQVEADRQQIREFRLADFLQRWSGSRPEGYDLIDILTVVQTVRVELQDTLWLTNHFMEDTNVPEMIRIAPAIWEDIRDSLEAILMDLSTKLSSCEVLSSPLKVPIKDLTEPAKIQSARRINTRFGTMVIVLHITTSAGEERVVRNWDYFSFSSQNSNGNS
ncbi:uncharacterized protein LOC128989089 [Macrosteles quadrilineatus]|uniref:uncharacterized protein LOC128989089 n=1 Tax=Macrosteles quadrilineatus TaxID=74068 RepID=UPI0023E29C54|nr:uncharacterized protein LOC128989089 [Macrosteles quadrilineatus]